MSSDRAHALLLLRGAARIAGLPAERIRTVPATADLRIDVSSAAAMIAAHLYRRLAQDGRFEVPWQPDLTVVLFRLRGTDERNRRFLAEINATRRVYLSSTTIDGRFFLRLCVLNFRTHADRLEEALGIIRTAASREVR